MKTSRRDFVKTLGVGVGAAAATGLAAMGGRTASAATREFNISLAAWSLHKAIGSGQLPMLDMPKVARQMYDIEAIELVNRLLEPCEKSFAEQKPYLDQLAKNAADNNVKFLLIMVDGEGNIGGREEGQREEAITRHSKWVDIANYLGCHSIRMNWAGAPRGVEKDAKELEAFIERSVAPLQKLCEYGDSKSINVIIENHGGPSSYPDAMKRLIEAVKHPRFGTLPDFGNFPPEIDPYDAVDVLMNYAKAVSAKCHDFDDTTGNETKLDYERLLQIVVDKHGYHGYIGIEYEGDRLSEYDGIKACKKLLDRLKSGAAA